MDRRYLTSGKFFEDGKGGKRPHSAGHDNMVGKRHPSKFRACEKQVIYQTSFFACWRADIGQTSRCVSARLRERMKSPFETHCRAALQCVVIDVVASYRLVGPV